MKVSELIKFLKKHDKNLIVGRFDVGQDSGDWYEMDIDEIKLKSIKEIDQDEL
jgi:hypothetical protein